VQCAPHAPVPRRHLVSKDATVQCPSSTEGGLFVWGTFVHRNSAHVHEPFEFSRFQISKATMNDLAYEHGMRPPRQSSCPWRRRADPVVRHLALAMLKRVAFFGQEREDRSLPTGVALGLLRPRRSEVRRERVEGPPFVGILAPWQVRRKKQIGCAGT